jgi:hypothetical protein
MRSGPGWIQVGSATLKFVFAPEERDVYSYDLAHKDENRRPKGHAGSSPVPSAIFFVTTLGMPSIFQKPSVPESPLLYP